MDMDNKWVRRGIVAAVCILMALILGLLSQVVSLAVEEVKEVTPFWYKTETPTPKPPTPTLVPTPIPTVDWNMVYRAFETCNEFHEVEGTKEIRTIVCFPKEFYTNPCKYEFEIVPEPWKGDYNTYATEFQLRISRRCD
jgi:hypothetical protein